MIYRPFNTVTISANNAGNPRPIPSTFIYAIPLTTPVIANGVKINVKISPNQFLFWLFFKISKLHGY